MPEVRPCGHEFAGAHELPENSTVQKLRSANNQLTVT